MTSTTLEKIKAYSKTADKQDAMNAFCWDMRTLTRSSKKSSTGKLGEYLMNRLTDRKTAEALKHNCEGLIRAGIQPDRMYLEYIKLAEYENEEERKEKTLVNYDPDEWYE